MSNHSFSQLPLKALLVDNLATLDYHRMTAIQAQSLPPILDGKDIIGQAKTGSGKTAAFGLGLLNKLDVKNFRVQALVLCPTRELADQVAKEIRKLARTIHNIKVLCLCGGVPFGPQVGSLERGAHVVVGTPGRVEEHLRKNNFQLDDLSTFVLDEADRMLDSGFQASLDAIINYVPEQHQTLLFSATYPKKIQAIADRVTVDPVIIKVLDEGDANNIEQSFFNIGDATNDTDHRSSGGLGESEQRLRALKLLLLEYRPQSTLVFCNTKKETQTIASVLKDDGFSAIALHGDLEQKDRDRTLVRFANKSVSVLVATDVAARGLDIDKLEAVINYQISRELEVHTHRVGRTGRADHSGLALTLFSDKEQHKLNKLEDYLQYSVDIKQLPNEKLLDQPRFKAALVTLQIEGGKKQKLRPGDILGALTGENGIDGHDVGKIAIFEFCAYVAVNRRVANDALSKLEMGKLKGRSFRVRRI